VGAVLKAVAFRKAGARLVVAGCLAARYAPELARGLPEADLIIGPRDYDRFPERLAALFRKTAPGPAGPFESWGRLTGTPPWRAFLKVAEGCDHGCSYCLIPSLRGPLRSRPMAELLAEAEALAEAGVKELTLVAQDLTAWRDGDLRLPDLLSALSGLAELAWLRIMYAYPERLTKALIGGLAAIPKLAPYVDVPVQHASPAILRRMGRRPGDPLELVGTIRSLWPGVAIRTTLMVGFPGETEVDYELLAGLVDQGAFDHVGVFKFSAEEGVPAASMPGQVPAGVKERRRRNLMSRQRKISLAHNRRRIGSEIEVLVEGPSPDSDLVMVGRGPFQAPEVDGLIYFDGPQPEPGSLVKAVVSKAGHYDLVARLTDERIEA
jgi:MiaB/RimO family radical SAM methylthiotransferase